MLCVPLKSVAGIDPGRVAAIELASDQAKKTIESQEKAQLLMTTGHVWIKEEVEATTDFQREFNDYLDKFHDVLSIAAEIYGIYYEVTQTSKCVKDLGHVLADSPVLRTPWPWLSPHAAMWSIATSCAPRSTSSWTSVRCALRVAR